MTVAADGDNLSVRASGERAKISEPLAEVLAGTADLTLLDARLVQPYYSKQLAASAGLELTMAMNGDDVLVQARAA